jgi:hypothetical protein
MASWLHRFARIYPLPEPVRKAFSFPQAFECLIRFFLADWPP